jgi:hypothetical protein
VLFIDLVAILSALRYAGPLSYKDGPRLQVLHTMRPEEESLVDRAMRVMVSRNSLPRAAVRMVALHTAAQFPGES